MTQHPRADRGAVTAEFAVILPAIVLVIAVLINMIAIGIQQSQLHQAAAIAARQLARGETQETIHTTVTTMTSTATTVHTGTNNQWAQVELTKPVPGPLSLIPTLQLTAEAKAPNQWSVTP